MKLEFLLTLKELRELKLLSEIIGFLNELIILQINTKKPGYI